MTLEPVLDAAKRTVARALTLGAIAVDATVGNGYDTCFLAEHVGEEGRVYGFDVQAQALDRTRERLATADLLERVTLIKAGHEAMDTYLPSDAEGRVAAVMFNLGYLPGSDKTCITRPDTTVAALDLSVRFLRPGGVLSVVLYTGHDGGADEAEAVTAWARALDPSAFRAIRYRFINQPNDPPQLLAVERRRE